MADEPRCLISDDRGDLIPAPRFLALGSVLGFRLRGWLGAVIASVALVTPASLIIFIAVIDSRPSSCPVSSRRSSGWSRSQWSGSFLAPPTVLKLAQQSGGFNNVAGMRLPTGHLLSLAIVAVLVLGAPIIPVVLISVAASYAIGGSSIEVGR